MNCFCKLLLDFPLKVVVNALKSGESKSCGCLGTEIRRKPHARILRLQTLRRYEQKPETKELQRRYRQNLPIEVRNRKNERAKIYRQTPEGKAKRKLEIIQHTEWFRTPEGRAKKRVYHQKHKMRSNQRYNERYHTDSQFRILARASYLSLSELTLAATGKIISLSPSDFWHGGPRRGRACAGNQAHGHHR